MIRKWFQLEWDMVTVVHCLLSQQQYKGFLQWIRLWYVHSFFYVVSPAFINIYNVQKGAYFSIPEINCQVICDVGTVEYRIGGGYFLLWFFLSFSLVSYIYLCRIPPYTMLQSTEMTTPSFPLLQFFDYTLCICLEDILLFFWHVPYFADSTLCTETVVLELPFRLCKSSDLIFYNQSITTPDCAAYYDHNTIINGLLTIFMQGIC